MLSTMKYKRVFYPGRFQPVHLGHVHAITWLLENAAEELVVGVTAAQYNYTWENPFTAGERIEMLKRALEDTWHRLYVIPLDNVPDNRLWLRHVETRTPRFEAVATNNTFVELLAEERGLPVVKPPLYRREHLSGTHIRRLMASEGDWEPLVPKSVADFISEIGGAERVKRIASSEKVIIPKY